MADKKAEGMVRRFKEVIDHNLKVVSDEIARAEEDLLSFDGNDQLRGVRRLNKIIKYIEKRRAHISRLNGDENTIRMLSNNDG